MRDRDELSEELTRDLEVCPVGDGKHKWLATFWQHEIDEYATYSYDNRKIPIHATVKFEMVCICGAHIAFDRGKRLL